MDKIEKVLRKLNRQERQKLKEILAKIKFGDFEALDLKKLKGRENIFRVRKGKIRVIFYKEGSIIKILSLERRSDSTY